MDKAFTMFLWENEPSVKTPINETNLNSMNHAINVIDNRVIGLDTSKLSVQTANSMTKDITIDVKTGIITETKLDGSQKTWDFNVEKIPVRFFLEDDTILVMETDDGTQYRVDLIGLVDTYVFTDSNTISFTMTAADGVKTVTASIKAGSITRDMIDPDYLAEIITSVNTAQSYAQSAAQSAVLSERWAVGRPVEYPESVTDNSKYYSEQAEKYAKLAEETAKISLPKFHIDLETMELIGVFEPPLNFYIDDEGCLISEIIEEVA